MIQKDIHFPVENFVDTNFKTFYSANMMNQDLTCPVCNGTGRRTTTDPFKKVLVGYDTLTDTVPCNNCGGQTMFGRASGKVRPRKDNGQPCVHEYDSYNIGRCLTQYVCKHCDYRFQIDSGD